MTGKGVVTYARETIPSEDLYDPLTTYRLDKWAKLDEALADTRADVIAIAFPEVIGENFSELVINLGKIAASGKMLMIGKASPYLRRAGVIPAK